MSFRQRYCNSKILFEFGAGVVFFVVNSIWGVEVGIIALILATFIFVGLSLWWEKRVPVFPIIGLVLVALLGGFSLVLGDETFIKIKPTIGKVIFAGVILVGLLLKPVLLERALQGQVYLTGVGWRVLTFWWVAIALGFAAMNEIVWRQFVTDTWVMFTSFVMPMSIVCYIVVTRLTAGRYWDKSKKIDTI